MKIPYECSSSQVFWRRLIQLANLLMINFPRQYDNDTRALAEDLVQETYSRILEAREPPQPIENWPRYFAAVMRNVFFEERRVALKAHYAGRHKVAVEQLNDDTYDIAMPVEETLVDPAPLINEVIEWREEEQILQVKTQKLIKAVNERLLQIIDEEIKLISPHPAFRCFVEGCWLFGESANYAWESIKNSNPDASRASYYRRLGKLKLAVTRRWTALDIEGKGEV